MWMCEFVCLVSVYLTLSTACFFSLPQIKMNRVVVCSIFFLAGLHQGPRRAKAAPLMSPTVVELCGPNAEIKLTKTGETSSMAVTLAALGNKNICQLVVTAPATHVINMQFVQMNVEKQQQLSTMFNKTKQHPKCIMSIYLAENPRTAVWQGDPCSGNVLPEIDLLTPGFKIIWRPPPQDSLIRRKFVLTTVGQGSVCKEPGQHTCMRIGWSPMLCVSDYLLCDGTKNCPPSSRASDEDEQMCKSHLMAQTSWEQFAVEIFKQLKPPPEVVNNNKWLQNKFNQQLSSPAPTLQVYRFENRTTPKAVVEDKPKAAETVSQALSKYGPWGYLMLGMLICGTVLMCCGLWECCLRKPKTPAETPPSTQPTTVLIINRSQDELSNSPPNYDDLDQPPSYTTLFPNLKRNESSSIIQSGGNSTLRNEQTQNIDET